MAQDTFLVTTSVNGRNWHVVWNPEKPLNLDFPVHWRLIMRGNGVEIHDLAGSRIEIDSNVLTAGRRVLLPEISGEPRRIKLQLKKLRPIKAAYHSDTNEKSRFGKAHHFISFGIRDCMIRFQPMRKRYKAMVEKTPVFTLQTTDETNFRVAALQRGVRFKILGEKWVPLIPGNEAALTAKQISGGAFYWGSYWWRINPVATPQMPTADEFEEDEAEQSTVSLQGIGKGLGATFIIGIIIMRLIFYVQQYHTAPKPPPAAVTELKKPKVIPVTMKLPPKPKPPEPPKPKPPEPPKPKFKPPEPPKPRPKPKPEPPKPLKRESPKKLLPPQPKKLLPLPPVRVPPPAKAPVPMAKVLPAPVQRRVPMPVVPPVTSQKAALSKSLSFLSAPAKSAAPLAIIPGMKASSKYQNVGPANTGPKGSLLNKMSAGQVSDGVISTRGARNIASNLSLTGRGKALNDVQGKVSLSAIYGHGSGDSLGAALGGGSAQVSGPGKLSDAVIEKTLSKYLQRFQYCYEKALLASPNLVGSVQMQWTIQVGGAVTGARVVQSAMNSTGLQSCLTQELSKIVFPSPSGGAVVVKKPFNFSSSSF